MAAVKKNDIAKVTKLTEKGLDPNFIDLEHGGGQLQHCDSSIALYYFSAAARLIPLLARLFNYRLTTCIRQHRLPHNL